MAGQWKKSSAEKYCCTSAQITLSWIISHPLTIAIPKALDPAHIKENAEAADINLSKDDFKEINQVFKLEFTSIEPGVICVASGGQGNRKAYSTLQEAPDNPLGFVPSPRELALELNDGEALKPIRVIRRQKDNSGFQYDLIEGRIRYWAWVIATNGKKPIVALVRDEL